MNVSDTKICSHCKVEKSVEEFSKDNSREDKLRYWCKDCESAHHKEYYEQHKEEIKEKNNKWYAANGDKGVAQRKRKREERLEERRRRVLEGLKKEQPSEESC